MQAASAFHPIDDARHVYEIVRQAQQSAERYSQVSASAEESRLP